MDLFDTQRPANQPLADRMRPERLEDFIGQTHLLAEGKLLRRAIAADKLTSCIFFGPPGCGKTTLAHVIACTTGGAFEKLNAVSSGVGDLREVIARAEERRKQTGQRTYLLLDECHRWSRAQADCILPAMESGCIHFVGSTTENPAIAMSPALISRCRLFRFYPLSQDDVLGALHRALADKQRGFGDLPIVASPAAIEHIARIAAGDVRTAYNALELAVLTTPYAADGTLPITLAVAEESIQQKVLAVDEGLYYDMLSAFCKCLRGSDSDAALLWAMALLDSGCDPCIIARRLIAHASEDIGLANPQAMLQAIAAAQSVQLIGLPECKLSLAQAIIFLCESPKSNAVVAAIGAATADIPTLTATPVPIHLQDASYAGHVRLGTGEGYKYPHDYPGHYVPQQYRPEQLEGHRYYEPSDQGHERDIRALRVERGIDKET